MSTKVLQSHVDMVHEKNNDVDFDFKNSGIKKQEYFSENPTLTVLRITLNGFLILEITSSNSLIACSNEKFEISFVVIYFSP